MDKYIKLDDAIATLHKYFPLSFDRQDAEDDLKSIPAADVEEVKHGEWLEGNRWQLCSKCRKRGKKSWHYCPNCGARMDEKEKADG